MYDPKEAKRLLHSIVRLPGKSHWRTVASKRSVLRSKRADVGPHCTALAGCYCSLLELKVVAQQGVVKHWEVARSSQRALQRGMLGSHIPLVLKQVVLLQLAPSQLIGSAGPTSQAAYTISQK